MFNLLLSERKTSVVNNCIKGQMNKSYGHREGIGHIASLFVHQTAFGWGQTSKAPISLSVLFLSAERTFIILKVLLQFKTDNETERMDHMK